MSRVVLDLVEHVTAIAAGGTVSVPAKKEDLKVVEQWCSHTGNQLVSLENGMAIIRRGRAEIPLPALPVPRLWIYTNFDCNLACDYCCARSSPKARRRAVGLENVARLAAEAADAGVQEIFLTGGEPFLLLDLDQTVHACVQQLPTTVLTNGMLFHGRRLDMLRRMPRDGFTLQISVDSATPAQHDRHRGQGSWHKAMQGVRLALVEGFHVRVAATVAPSEENDLSAFHTMLDEMGVAMEDQVVRPVALRGFAHDGVALTVETLVPEVTVTAEGIYWHPVGADHLDQLVSRDLFPLAAAIDETQIRFANYRRTIGEAADRFPCA